MTGAFRGDAAIKADLLARLRAHAAAGTLLFGATRWDGERGSPLGVSAESEDSADYAARFGYPLALAALLDPMIECSDPARAWEHTLTWVVRVSPGEDLSVVPVRIVEDMLIRIGSVEHAPALHAAILDLHHRELAGETLTRADWTQARGEIEAAADGMEDAAGAVALRACAAACWPLRTSRSVLTEITALWRTGAGAVRPTIITSTDKIRAEAILQSIVAAVAPRRAAGEYVDIPKLFRARDPGLSARYEADLRRTNALALERMQALPGIVLGHLTAAGVA
ncbi:hypothetical protein [Sphingomonas sp. CLY1604]|uniref:hypothetical protein n=1 Tax=Sphingomonas sp. CLY1604 TaxID=3457786 RepID=UPI003FD810D8